MMENKGEMWKMFFHGLLMAVILFLFAMGGGVVCWAIGRYIIQ